MIHFLFIMILLATATYDAAAKKIPNLFPILIIALALCQIITDPSDIAARMIGMLVVSLPMLLLALRYGGLGGGDIKLTAACGLFLGTDAVLTGCFAAAVLALISRFVCCLSKKRKRSAWKQFCQASGVPFAFGPYLAVGFILASCWNLCIS